ncbi:MAG: PAS domain-containing sensor histidine kinase [Puniceicoccales bacterium]|nr:PAS domain-containing sensor histidine kinase [Puniceicoccales bacterium]
MGIGIAMRTYSPLIPNSLTTGFCDGVSSERFKELLPIPTLLTDAQGRILQANRAAQHFLGYTGNSLDDLKLEQLVFRYGVLKRTLQREPKATDSWKLPLKFRHAQGQLLSTETMIVRESALEDGRMGFYIWDMRDMQKKARALKAKWQRAEQANQTKSLFVSLISHEFRTPMASIQAAAELLRNYGERFSPEERQEQLRQISVDIFRMSQMMDDVLLLGKIQNQQLSFRATLVDPLTLCQDAIQFVQPRGGQSRVLIMVSGKFPPICSLDPSLFRHILINLLSNALKYSPPDSKVTLSLRRDRQDLILEVVDKGIGIPPEDHGKIFHLFHRGNNVGMVKGIGVGMFMLKYCVELHRGKIAFKSTLGVGTTFQVRLPVGLQGKKGKSSLAEETPIHPVNVLR